MRNLMAHQTIVFSNRPGCFDETAVAEETESFITSFLLDITLSGAIVISMNVFLI
jgi:hypothetical protein